MSTTPRTAPARKTKLAAALKRNMARRKAVVAPVAAKPAAAKAATPKTAPTPPEARHE